VDVMKPNKSKSKFIPHLAKSSRTFAKPDDAKFTRVQELVYELKVNDAMRQNVITTIPDTSMSKLGEVLRSNRISGTPVVEGDKLVGIISIEDFIKWLAEGDKDCLIKDKMTNSCGQQT